MSGRLIVVATPIGNLGDLSPRAIEALAGADVVACEDTRRTRKLFAHAGVAAPTMVVVNEHTERDRCAPLVARLAEGEMVVLVSDAGMPVVSDPGQLVIDAAIDGGFAVEVIPGPSAGLAALVASGLSAGRHCFEGFLPRSGPARRRRLETLVDEERTVVLYEAPHRLARTLADLEAVVGPHRPIAVARELTKLHEEIYRGDVAGARRWATDGAKGEMVVVLGGAPVPDEPDDARVIAAVEAARARGDSHAVAARAAAAELGVSRRRAYELTLERD